MANLSEEMANLSEMYGNVIIKRKGEKNISWEDTLKWLEKFNSVTRVWMYNNLDIYGMENITEEDKKSFDVSNPLEISLEFVGTGILLVIFKDNNSFSKSYLRWRSSECFVNWLSNSDKSMDEFMKENPFNGELELIYNYDEQEPGCLYLSTDNSLIVNIKDSNINTSITSGRSITIEDIEFTERWVDENLKYFVLEDIMGAVNNLLTDIDEYTERAIKLLMKEEGYDEKMSSFLYLSEKQKEGVDVDKLSFNTLRKLSVEQSSEKFVQYLNEYNDKNPSVEKFVHWVLNNKDSKLRYF